MQDINFIIDYVPGDARHIRDDFGTSSQAHASDISLGGTDIFTLLEGQKQTATRLPADFTS